MPLTLDPTIGGEDANTYADVTQADAWLAFRVGAGAWAAYADDLKAQALASATRDIDTLDFIGSRATDTQALEWPRIVDGYDADELPSRLVQATIELAFVYARDYTADATADPINPDTARLKRKKTGPLEKEWFEPAAQAATDVERLPSVVQRLLAPLLRVVAVAGWGSAIAIRSS